MLLSKQLVNLTDKVLSHIEAIPSSDFHVELKRWMYKKLCIDASLQDRLLLTKDMYPNLHNMFSVLLTMSVSSVSAERSFSALRRLITYMRFTMASDRLTALALFNIHKDIALDIDKAL